MWLFVALCGFLGLHIAFHGCAGLFVGTCGCVYSGAMFVWPRVCVCVCVAVCCSLGLGCLWLPGNMFGC